jgi:hypothetical protein
MSMKNADRACPKIDSSLIQCALNYFYLVSSANAKRSENRILCALQSAATCMEPTKPKIFENLKIHRHFYALLGVNSVYKLKEVMFTINPILFFL